MQMLLFVPSLSYLCSLFSSFVIKAQTLPSSTTSSFMIWYEFFSSSFFNLFACFQVSCCKYLMRIIVQYFITKINVMDVRYISLLRWWVWCNFFGFDCDSLWRCWFLLDPRPQLLKGTLDDMGTLIVVGCQFVNMWANSATRWQLLWYFLTCLSLA